MIHRIINYLHSWIDEQKQQNAIKAYAYTSDGSTRAPVDITGEWWMDTWFGGLPTNPLTSNGQVVYAVVREADDAVEYTAQLVLAESGESKTSHLGQTYLAKDLDYHLQVRNHFGYSEKIKK